MRDPIRRLAALGAAAFAIWSCDAVPTDSRFGNGISGGATGTAPVVPPAPGSVDADAPFVRINTPVATPIQLINIGDSILVETELSDQPGRQISHVEITGWKEVGDPDLGTFQRIPRYPTVRVPASGSFPAGTIDTTVRRYLHPAFPIDTTIDDLIIEAVVTDGAGNVDTATRLINLVTGPDVTIIDPVNGQTVPRGDDPMRVRVQAEHATAVQSVTITVQSGTGFLTPIDTTDVLTFPAGTQSGTHEILVPIPANAPIDGVITITASAVDVNGNPGSTAPVTVNVREAGTIAPLVTQVVAPKLEISDTIFVSALGDGIVTVGFVLIDRNTGLEVKRYSEVVPASVNLTHPLPLNLTLEDQGLELDVYSFATDNSPTPLTGYSVAAGSTVSVQLEAAAHRDTTLITNGRTFPLLRQGVIGDVAIDPLGNVFLSNTQFNLLEVWQNSSKVFATTGIAVGSLPWGLFLSSNPDTLLVANSGATTISRVFVGSTTPSAMREDLSRRIRTRENVVYQVQFIRDPASGKVKINNRGSTEYSDRPQYVAESEAGRVYFSTRPTSTARPGTIRWLDPALEFADPQQITSYGSFSASADIIYTIFGADSIAINPSPANSPASDILILFDHVYGDTVTIVVSDSIPLDARTKARALGSDVEMLLNFDLPSLNLTDTTFVAASGDRKWIGFGEGNTAGGPGRVMLVNDPIGPAPGFFSPGISVGDLVSNAAEQVFGLAIDSTGGQVAAHGLQTYLAALDQPYHLRLDGVYDSFDNGAGVAYHPRAQSTGSDPDFRIAFSATTNGVIEVMDVAHYNNRGRLVTKNNLYGPLRVTGPFPEDNAGKSCAAGTRAGDDADCVIMKVYGLTATGLVVIDVLWKDIALAP